MGGLTPGLNSYRKNYFFIRNVASKTAIACTSNAIQLNEIDTACGDFTLGDLKICECEDETGKSLGPACCCEVMGGLTPGLNSYRKNYFFIRNVASKTAIACTSNAIQLN